MMRTQSHSNTLHFLCAPFCLAATMLNTSPRIDTRSSLSVFRGTHGRQTKTIYILMILAFFANHGDSKSGYAPTGAGRIHSRLNKQDPNS